MPNQSYPCAWALFSYGIASSLIKWSKAMASGNDHKEHNNTYAKVFVPMIKWGTPIFALILLIVVFFTT
jgi:hypothetical protein